MFGDVPNCRMCITSVFCTSSSDRKFSCTTDGSLPQHSWHSFHLHGASSSLGTNSEFDLQSAWFFQLETLCKLCLVCWLIETCSPDVVSFVARSCAVYRLERQVGTQIDGCGRIRIMGVATCMLPIIDADSRSFLQKPIPILLKTGVLSRCCNDARARLEYLRCGRTSYGRTSVKQMCKLSWKEWVLVRQSVGEEQDLTPRMSA